MIYEKIDLYKYFNIKRKCGEAGYLNIYAPSAVDGMKPKLRPAMLILAGGGYAFVSQRESEPVALKYLSNGFACFALEYTANTAYPVPLNEACMAMAYIREQAEKYRIDVEHICAIGFSAGGHLAGMLATLTDDEASNALGGKAKLAKPNAVVLAYPVVSLNLQTRGQTRKVIASDDESLFGKLSVDKRVNANSAPVYVWHVYEDDIVSVQHSLMLAQAYHKAGVPFEMHIFEKGWHGVSVCSAETENDMGVVQRLKGVAKWFDMSLFWLQMRGFCVVTQG